MARAVLAERIEMVEKIRSLMVVAAVGNSSHVNDPDCECCFCKGFHAAGDLVRALRTVKRYREGKCNAFGEDLGLLAAMEGLIDK